jgi:hypothetical protein
VVLFERFATRTEDRALAAELWPRVAKVLARMEGLRGPDGWIARDWAEANKATPDWTREFEKYPPLTPWLFIDHPGMGWHNLEEPPIDRRGVNTALHALLVSAGRAGAKLAALAGRAEEGRGHARAAEELAGRVRARFWDAERGLFPDGLAADGGFSASGSAQTNTLALLAGLAPEGEARGLALRAAEGRLPGAWNGPYMDAFLLDVLEGLGMREEARAMIERKWGRMVARGARTVWETFAGDHLDSWCHPWSAAPLVVLPRVAEASSPGASAGRADFSG